MSTARPRPLAGSPVDQPVRRIGSVNYLNARPLIDGLDSQADSAIQFDIPSRLLEDLESGLVNIALCPVIDYYRSRQPLEIVPVGGIGSQGQTLTVRLFSRVPIKQIEAVHADTDSHTSVALLRLLLSKRFGITPQIMDYDTRQPAVDDSPQTQPPTMLLIGDKVVINKPSETEYPHQMDLGQAWHELTGLPFVFAVWMARRDADLGDLPDILERTRIENSKRIDQIVARHAAPHGWPTGLARRYLTRYMRFEIGPRELEAIERFAEMAHELGLIDNVRPLCVRGR